MSNINSNSKNVRTQNPLDTAPAQRPQVGLNYGDRAKFQKISQPLPPARPPVDQFKSKKDVDAGQFASNAAYRSQRRQFVEGYKPRLLDHVENGTAPQVAKNSGIPSDDAILTFLDRVINQPSKTAAARAAAPAAKKTTFIKA